MVLVGALYHPPKAIYNVSCLVEFIDKSIEEFLIEDPEDDVLLGGDFNQLEITAVSASTGLTPRSLVKSKLEERT